MGTLLTPNTNTHMNNNTEINTNWTNAQKEYYAQCPSFLQAVLAETFNSQSETVIDTSVVRELSE
jgi:hypothetical protein